MQYVILHAERPDFENQEPLEQITRVSRTSSVLLEMTDEYLDENRQYSGAPGEDRETINWKNFCLQDIRSEAMQVRQLVHLAKAEARLGQALIYTQKLKSHYAEMRDAAWQFCDLECPELIPALEQSL
jgi:hypothetical protein